MLLVVEASLYLHADLESLLYRCWISAEVCSKIRGIHMSSNGLWNLDMYVESKPSPSARNSTVDSYAVIACGVCDIYYRKASFLVFCCYWSSVNTLQIPWFLLLCNIVLSFRFIFWNINCHTLCGLHLSVCLC